MPAEITSTEEIGEVSSEDYRFLFENMLNGFAYCRMIYNDQGKPVDFVYLQVNDAFEKLTGLKKEVVVGKKVTKAIPGIEKANPELFQIYGRVALTGRAEKFEVFFKPLNKWFFISVYSPKKSFFVAIFENITERKANEALLKSSVERFMTLADCLPDVVFETDLTGKLTYVNQKAFDLTGYTKEDFAKGVYNYDFIAPQDLERAKANYTKSMVTSSPTFNEYSFVRKDGSEFPVIIKGLPIKFENKTVGMRGIIIDITEQKKTIDKLAFQAQLLEAVGQAIIAIDKDRIIRYWNNGAKKLYGWSAEDALGRDIGELLREFSAEETYEICERLAAGECWSSEIQVKRRDGSSLPVIVNRYPVIDENHEFIGSISVYTDITDQKSMEAELAGYVDALASSSEKIKDLNDKLRVVESLTRHDIRNKLTALNGCMFLLKKKIGDNQTSLKYLGEMEKVFGQLLDILEFEQVYEQVGSEELTFVDVGKFFSEAVALVSDSKGLKMTCTCDGLEVRADSLLRQVIYNLIDNTLKHGGKATSIRLCCKKESNNLLLIYEDNGKGISEEQRLRLFEKGFGKGTGIGLHMIKRIIDTYDWALEENGELGVGARFTMKIPYKGYKLSEKLKQALATE
ncbi:MAG: PAS domain S-box protein [Chloroflexi bacterium]|nr:PAS domain S-box protein [Chloroflexota bacterium]